MVGTNLQAVEKELTGHEEEEEGRILLFCLIPYSALGRP
jgi:hypothetical protein